MTIKISGLTVFLRDHTVDAQLFDRIEGGECSTVNKTCRIYGRRKCREADYLVGCIFGIYLRNFGEDSYLQIKWFERMIWEL